MKELKCPKCGNMFTVDESDYAVILQQVKTAEFESELNARIAAIRKGEDQARLLALKEQEGKSAEAV